LWPLALKTKRKTITQGDNSSLNGSIQLAIWHKDGIMTVHIYQCKDLLKGSLSFHNYVQTVILDDEKTRRVTPIVSGKDTPEFDTKITVR